MPATSAGPISSASRSDSGSAASVSDAGSGYHAAAVELNRRALVDEGFPPDTIEVVGNTVVDATRAAQADGERVTVFESYPQLRTG